MDRNGERFVGTYDRGEFGSAITDHAKIRPITVQGQYAHALLQASGTIPGDVAFRVEETVGQDTLGPRSRLRVIWSRPLDVLRHIDLHEVAGMFVHDRAIAAAMHDFGVGSDQVRRFITAYPGGLVLRHPDTTAVLDVVELDVDGALYFIQTRDNRLLLGGDGYPTWQEINVSPDGESIRLADSEMVAVELDVRTDDWSIVAQVDGSLDWIMSTGEVIDEPLYQGWFPGDLVHGVFLGSGGEEAFRATDLGLRSFGMQIDGHTLEHRHVQPPTAERRGDRVWISYPELNQHAHCGPAGQLSGYVPGPVPKWDQAGLGDLRFSRDADGSMQIDYMHGGQAVAVDLRSGGLAVDMCLGFDRFEQDLYSFTLPGIEVLGGWPGAAQSNMNQSYYFLPGSGGDIDVGRFVYNEPYAPRPRVITGNGTFAFDGSALRSSEPLVASEQFTRSYMDEHWWLGGDAEGGRLHARNRTGSRPLRGESLFHYGQFSFDSVVDIGNAADALYVQTRSTIEVFDAAAEFRLNSLFADGVDVASDSTKWDSLNPVSSKNYESDLIFDLAGSREQARVSGNQLEYGDTVMTFEQPFWSYVVQQQLWIIEAGGDEQVRWIRPDAKWIE